MHHHVYGDESKAQGLLLAAALVPPEKLESLRATVCSLRYPGMRRIHFAREQNCRRKQIIKVLAAEGARAVIYDATSIQNGQQARIQAISQLVDDALAARAARLVLERDDSLVESDLAVIRQRLRAADSPVRLHYDHQRAHEECLLSIPDAIAWCWAKGGEWRKLAESIVEDVRLVDKPDAA